MTNSNPTSAVTTATVKTSRIRQLRDNARLANDVLMAELCEIALSGADSDGSGTALGRPCTLEEAVQACVDAINYSERG